MNCSIGRVGVLIKRVRAFRGDPDAGRSGAGIITRKGGGRRHDQGDTQRVKPMTRAGFDSPVLLLICSRARSRPGQGCGVQTLIGNDDAVLVSAKVMRLTRVTARSGVQGRVHRSTTEPLSHLPRTFFNLGVDERRAMIHTATSLTQTRKQNNERSSSTHQRDERRVGGMGCRRP